MDERLWPVAHVRLSQMTLVMGFKARASGPRRLIVRGRTANMDYGPPTGD